MSALWCRRWCPWLAGALLTASLLALASASGAHAASVRVARCPTTYGISQPTKALPASESTRLSATAARGLEFYANNELLVLAPVGWHCSGQIGADGSAGMAITQGRSAIAVQAVPYTSGVGASVACSLFADAHSPEPCEEHPPAAERISRLSSTAVAFEDPPGVHGTGYRSGGALPANGVMVFSPSESRGFFYEETCVLAAAEHALCTELLDDALSRAPR